MAADGLSSVDDDQAAVETFLDLYCGLCITRSMRIRQELERGFMETHGVVVGHIAQVFEAQHAIDRQVRW